MKAGQHLCVQPVSADAFSADIEGVDGRRSARPLRKTRRRLAKSLTV